MRLLSIKTNVASLQAYGCKVCLHIGSVAFIIGQRKGDCLFRLELFTPLHRWRISTLRKKVLQPTTEQSTQCQHDINSFGVCRKCKRGLRPSVMA